ncbi:hypothetical protein M436DRAFT_40003 [Aureobasidium namibiae CBS 147.97]|uniref:Telomerase reverse transcriptase n=1 Tax=Aureobasidium namibiae CBS 147.97 TaxID=1043004 RepID=A0A074WSM0_9PEZI|nr:uncharacterized protein M436DRAFT_40003 [Aureobasidium namibiae CBS 147.97]KEQ76160.1 hypothetical protein M436DRAFT_40003 [Aureobasidium namibiae CBS 147.97]
MKRKRASRPEPIALKRTKTSNGAVKSNLQHIPSILRLYYPQVLTLREYLLQAHPSKNRKRQIQNYGDHNVKSSQGTNSDLANLLDSVLVGCHDAKKEEQNTTDYNNDLSVFSTQVSGSTARSSGSQTQLSFAEIVDFVTWRLFRQHTSGHRPPHVLCHGYYYDGLGDVKTSIKTITTNREGVPLDPNEHVERLKGDAWAGLTRLVGSKGTVTLIQLLQNCGMFMPLEGGRNNLIQISGVDLSELRTVDKHNPTGGQKPDGGAALEVANTDGTGFSSRHEINTLNTIRFVRHRILYRKPDLNAKGGAYFGLPHIRMSCGLHNSAQRLTHDRCLESHWIRQRSRQDCTPLEVHFSTPIWTSQCLHPRD